MKRLLTWLCRLFVCTLWLHAIPVSAQGQSRADWMAALSDTVSLSQLNIPGSRQTTYTENSDFFTSWYYIQSGSVAEHLDRGIRVLDIWLKGDGDAGLKVYYDKTSAPETRFVDGVLAPVSSFLAQHPTETVLILVRAETDTEVLGNRLDAALSAYADKGYRTDISPSVRLGDMRGKFALIRCGSGVASISSQDLTIADLWPRDAETVQRTISRGEKAAPLQIADYYRQSGTSRDWTKKKASLTKNLNDAAASPFGCWYITFAGFERTSVGPAEFSRLINPFLTARMTEAPEAKTGIVLLDCILGSKIIGTSDHSTEQVLAAIVASNDRYKLNKWMGSLNTDPAVDANWAMGYVQPSDGTADLVIEPSARHPIAIRDTASYRSIQNDGSVGIEVRAGGLLRLLGGIQCPKDKSGIRLYAGQGKHTGRIYFADPRMAAQTVVEVEALPFSRVNDRWEYIAPLIETVVPVEIFGKRSVRLWDGKGWQFADSTAKHPAFTGLAVASSADSKLYVYRGHLAAQTQKIALDPVTEQGYKQQFVGNSFILPVAIRSISPSVEVDPCYYQLVSTPLSDYFQSDTRVAPTSAGAPMAAPQALAGLHGLPAMIGAGEAFFVFARGGSLSIPYTDPLAAVPPNGSLAANSIPALVTDLLSPEGNILDRSWLFLDPKYTDEYDAGYDGYKLHTPNRAEWMISSNHGALQVAALSSPSLTRFILRPAQQAQGYSLRFSAHDGAEELIRGYNIVDHYNGSIHPIELDKVYTIQMQPGETQRTFTIGRPEDTSSSTCLITTDSLACIPLSDGSIRIEKTQDPAQVHIYDARGAVVATYSLAASDSTTIIHSSLPPGMYVIRVASAGRVVVARFVR